MTPANPYALTRSHDEALNEAVAVLNGTNPTTNEIAIVAHLIRRGDRPGDIRDYVIRARAVFGESDHRVIAPPSEDLGF